MPSSSTLTRIRARLTSEPFHPDLRAAARVLPAGIVRGPRTLGLMRRLEQVGPVEGAEAVVADGVKVLVFRPSGPVRGAVLWIHGGGMVGGAPQMDADLCRRISEEHAAVVVAPHYRRAPEHPFPAPLDDCSTALRWLAALPGVAGLPVVVAGASAGGGLAAGVALAARDRGDVDIAGQVLVYPMIDDRTAAAPDPQPETKRLWDNRANAFGWGAYLGTAPGSDGVSPHAAPARAEDLAGLPPTWIGVGTADLFHDEDVRYAQRLEEAGVPVDLEVVPGAFHGFDRAPTDVSRSFVDAYVAAVGRMLAG